MQFALEISLFGEYNYKLCLKKGTARRDITMKELTPQLIHSLKHYSRETFIKDLISGLIVAIIALPLSIALALASGVAPEQGL